LLKGGLVCAHFNGRVDKVCSLGPIEIRLSLKKEFVHPPKQGRVLAASTIRGDR
jgi:hypothetical protein